MELRADREYLRSVAYADDRFLRDRLSLYDHQHPRLDPVGETIRALGDVAGQRVADVGCGNGAYHAALHAARATIIAVDLSLGMLQAVPGQLAGRVAADAQALPLASASVDAALAMHMLYHVPEPTLAVAEFARVLRSGGRLVTAVSGPNHLAEAQELWMPLLVEAGLDHTVRDLGLVNNRLPAVTLREILDGSFDSVTSRTLTSQVILADPGPLVRHAASTAAAQVADDLGAAMNARLRDAAVAVIRRQGVLRITTEIAWFHAVAPIA
jgi:SAM-dependent methyltransferase